MDLSTKRFKKEMIKRHTPKTKLLLTSCLAFIFGGIISAVGEFLRFCFTRLGIEDKTSVLLVSLTFVLLASLFTALGIFDKIAKHAGAGTLVPITGFSNAVTSEAIDSSSEGYVLGVGAKIFTVAGPVLLFGISSGVLYGIIYYVLKTYMGV